MMGRFLTYELVSLPDLNRYLGTASTTLLIEILVNHSESKEVDHPNGMGKNLLCWIHFLDSPFLTRMRFFSPKDYDKIQVKMSSMMGIQVTYPP